MGWLGSLSFFKIKETGILALGLPILYVVNLIYVLFWLIIARTKRNALVSGFILLLSLWILPRFINISSEQTQGKLKIMTYNVKNFTPYKNIYNDEDIKVSTEQNNKMIAKQNPDIICFQEFNKTNGKKILQDYPYHISQPCLEGKYVREVAVVSKYPIISHHNVMTEGMYANNLIADIKVNDSIVRVFSVHLESLEYNPSTLNNIKDENTLKTETTDLYHRFTKGFYLHQLQIDAIMQEVEKSPYPVILCGDFNNGAFSYEYARANDDLLDTFKEKGNGIVNTYHRIPFPTRIDNIFVSDTFEVNSYQVVNEKISDHFPVIASVTFRQKN